jgi:hypothetical protein
MKGLKRISLVTAIMAASAAQAELVAMDDTAMGATTGQAGITIDINSAEISIGAIDYQDEGFITIQDVVLGGGTAGFGGPGDGVLNNIRMTVDVAGPGGSGLANSRAGETYIAGAAALVGGSVSGNYTAQTINDGDLVIALLAIDSSNLLQSVDYGLSIGSIGIAASTETVGAITNNTVLLSNLDLNGYLGPIELVVHNDNSGLNISAYFNAEGSMDMPFMNASTDLAIHNSRGADQVWLGTQNKGNSMAHVQLNVSQGTTGSGVTGLAFDLQNLEADIDLENVTFGAAPSIGDIYITDFRLTAQTVVYGH